ncbi:TPA: hypothetical protein ACGO4G_002036 [Streptococcus suis]
MKLNKIFVIFITIFFLFSNIIVPVASAEEVNYHVKNIEQLVAKAEEERISLGETTDQTVAELENELRSLGIEPKGTYGGTHVFTEEDGAEISENNVSFRYGQTHNLGKGWRYRVDKPSPGGKPHAHVYDSNGNEWVENCDGTPSHGKTLDGVPKKIRDKVRNSPDYQKGKKDIQKYRQAKAEINHRGLNLSINNDLLIAAGIIVAIVGVAYFAPAYIPGFLALV